MKKSYMSKVPFNVISLVTAIRITGLYIALIGRKQTELYSCSKVPMGVTTVAATLRTTVSPVRTRESRDTRSKVPFDVINLGLIPAMMQEEPRCKRNKGRRDSYI